MDSINTVGEASETTKRNVKKAKAYSFWAGPLHIEWKLRTGHFRFLPAWETMTTEFWNEGPVRWTRFYWLTVGVSCYRLITERRHTAR